MVAKGQGAGQGGPGLEIRGKEGLSLEIGRGDRGRGIGLGDQSLGSGGGDLGQEIGEGDRNRGVVAEGRVLEVGGVGVERGVKNERLRKIKSQVLRKQTAILMKLNRRKVQPTV